MKAIISKVWKNEIEKEIKALEEKRDNLFSDFVKSGCSDYILETQINYIEREIDFLRGQLYAINVINNGCYVEIEN